MNLKVVVLFLFLLGHTGANVVANELMDKEMIRSRFNALFSHLTSRDITDKYEAELIEKWEKYIEEKKIYPNSAFLSAIMDYQREYWNALAELSACLEKLENQEKQNDLSDWLTDLEATYGRNYIKRNRKAIISALSATHSGNCDTYCGLNWKDALSKEAFLFRACKMYLSEFLNFYERLDVNEKQKLKKRKDFVLVLLDDMEHGYIAVTYDAVSMLRPALEKHRAINDNKEIFEMLKKQPQLQRPYDLNSIISRLITITSN